MDTGRVTSDTGCSFHIHPLGSRYRFYATVPINQITIFTINSGFIVAENGYSNNPVVFSIVHSWNPLTVTIASTGFRPPFLVEYSFSVNVDLKSEEMWKFVNVENGDCGYSRSSGGSGMVVGISYELWDMECDYDER